MVIVGVEMAEDKDVLNRAKDLEKDIESIRSLTEDYEKGDGLHISSSFPCNYGQSLRFQKELCEWLRQKKSEYEKELEAL